MMAAAPLALTAAKRAAAADANSYVSIVECNAYLKASELHQDTIGEITREMVKTFRRANLSDTEIL